MAVVLRVHVGGVEAAAGAVKASVRRQEAVDDVGRVPRAVAKAHRADGACGAANATCLSTQVELSE